VRFDTRLVGLIESVAAQQGLLSRRITSGAGHDAQMMARICPSAMIFVPSHLGISHNPKEHTEPADLARGAQVLLDVMHALANEQAPNRLESGEVQGGTDPISCHADRPVR